MSPALAISPVHYLHKQARAFENGRIFFFSGYAFLFCYRTARTPRGPARVPDIAQSLDLLNPGGQSVSGYVVQAKMWMVYKTSVSHFMVKNTARKYKDGKGKFKIMLSFLLRTKEGFSLQNSPSRNSKFSSRPIGALGLF